MDVSSGHLISSFKFVSLIVPLACFWHIGVVPYLDLAWWCQDDLLVEPNQQVPVSQAAPQATAPQAQMTFTNRCKHVLCI